MARPYETRAIPRLRPAFLAIGIVAAVVVSFSARAQQSGSPSFGVTSTISAGGGESSSASFRVISSLDATGVAGESGNESSRLVSGGAVWLVSTRFDDDDGDSVPNGEEGSVRGGDGNGDAIADQAQPFVASLAGAGTPVTAELRSGGCGSITLAKAETEEELASSTRYGFPFALLRLKISCAAPGDETVVRVLYHAATGAPWPPAQFLAFGVRAPDFEGEVSYFPLQVEETGVATIGGASVPYVVVRLHDGMFGDQSAADAAIDLTAGPAVEARPIRR